MGLESDTLRSIEIIEEQIKGIKEAIKNNTLATSSIDGLKERIKAFEFVKETLKTSLAENKINKVYAL